MALNPVVVKMTGRKMTGRKMTGRKMTGRKMTGRKMTGRKMTGRKVTRTGRMHNRSKIKLIREKVRSTARKIMANERNIRPTHYSEEHKGLLYD